MGEEVKASGRGGGRKYRSGAGHWNEKRVSGHYVAPARHSETSGKWQIHADSTTLFPPVTQEVRFVDRIDPAHAPQIRRLSSSNWSDAGRIHQSSDYYRYIDTKLRRLESGDVLNSRVKLTGARLALKTVLDAVGQSDFVYPFIADDGDGGCFAEWKAGSERIEISAEEDGDGTVSISRAGLVEMWVEFDTSSGLSSDITRDLNARLARHSGHVKAVNPNWIRFFIAG